MSYHHLTREERGKLSLLYNNGVKIRQIARVLQRAPSTVSREVKRNRKQERYRAEDAHTAYVCRRRLPQPWKLKDPELENYVRAKLLLCWSPEEIAGRLPLEYPAQPRMRVSHSTIYRWLHRELLPQAASLKLKLRHHGRRRGEKRGQFHGVRELTERSRQALKRTRIGDWEVDTILSAGRQNRDSLLSVCDRKSRYCGLVLLRRTSAPEVLRGFQFLFGASKLPLLTMTADRGKEFACYKEVESIWKIPVYFCRPRSPWQKPSVENQNGLIRQFFPRGTDFKEITQEQVAQVMALLNNRPRKCLAFKTPHEVLHLT